MKKNKLSCNASALGKKVYKYHSGALGPQETKTFLRHLPTCAKCEKTLQRLNWIFETIRRTPEEFFKQEELGVRKTYAVNDAPSSRGLFARRWDTPEDRLFMDLIALKARLDRRAKGQSGKRDIRETAADLANFVTKHTSLVTRRRPHYRRIEKVK